MIKSSQIFCYLGIFYYICIVKKNINYETQYRRFNDWRLGND